LDGARDELAKRLGPPPPGGMKSSTCLDAGREVLGLPRSGGLSSRTRPRPPRTGGGRPSASCSSLRARLDGCSSSSTSSSVVSTPPPPKTGASAAASSASTLGSAGAGWTRHARGQIGARLAAASSTASSVGASAPLAGASVPPLVAPASSGLSASLAPSFCSSGFGDAASTPCKCCSTRRACRRG